MHMICLSSAIEYAPCRAALETHLLAVAQGDRQALAALYEATRTAVYGYALSILKNAQDAEDVLQETYLRIFDGAPGYESRGAAMAWIFRIVKNLALIKLRSSRRQLPDQTPEYFSPDTALSTQDRLLLTAAMERLDDQERQIVMLHAVAGFRHREIAEQMQLALSTVLSKYRRALGKLKQMLKESE